MLHTHIFRVHHHYFSMKIDHIAIWTEDIESTKNFYQVYFGMLCSEKYVNPSKGFSSYFLSFQGASTRIEIMHRPDILAGSKQRAAFMGLTHFAISVGSEARVNELTEQLRADDYTIVAEPRRTGDGCYESVVLDPEGNHVEITE
ncbi:MAG: VOC family protein [Bacteroidales bacterium]